MRLWTLHPQYLDVMGLLALWRETLLAQKVLAGQTVGYRNHPQLERFKSASYPEQAIGYYLGIIHEEAVRRQYQFNVKLIRVPHPKSPRIKVSSGQLHYEFLFLNEKLKKRSPAGWAALKKIHQIVPHPAFQIVDGDIESWERVDPKTK